MSPGGRELVPLGVVDDATVELPLEMERLGLEDAAMVGADVETSADVVQLVRGETPRFGTDSIELPDAKTDPDG